MDSSASVTALSLFQAAAAVDRERDTGDVTRLVGGQEQHGVCDVLRLHPADRQRVHQLSDDLHVLGARVLQVWTEQLHRAVVHEQRGVDVRRVHRVDTDVLCTELDGERPHQTDHAVFGGHIVAGVRVGLQAAHRTGQNDRAAAAARKDVRHTGFHRLPHPTEVDVDHVCPVALAGLVQRRTAVADAGVGDDDVQPAELLYARVHCGLQSVEVASVDLGGVDATVESLDKVGGFGQVLGRRQRNLHAVDLLTDVDGDDIGALFGQPNSVRTTLSTRRSGDESDLAFNTSCHFPTSIHR